jgi:hypothetical protein
MNNKVAVFLGLCVIGLVVFDARVNEGQYLVLWGKELLRLIDWIAFWR